MKSGLEGRNNASRIGAIETVNEVSMKSGLEGRNNTNLWRSLFITRLPSQ